MAKARKSTAKAKASTDPTPKRTRSAAQKAATRKAIETRVRNQKLRALERENERLKQQLEAAKKPSGPEMTTEWRKRYEEIGGPPTDVLKHPAWLRGILEIRMQQVVSDPKMDDEKRGREIRALAGHLHKATHDEVIATAAAIIQRDREALEDGGPEELSDAPQVGLRPSHTKAPRGRPKKRP